MPLDFAATAGFPQAPVRARVCRALHTRYPDQYRTEAVPKTNCQDNGKAGSTERQVTFWPKTRVLPSFL